MGRKSKKAPGYIPADDPLMDSRAKRQGMQGTPWEGIAADSDKVDNGPLDPPKKWFQTIEDLLTSPDGFALTTATVLQRAICKIIQGLPFNRQEAHAKSILRALGGRRWRSQSEVAHARKKRAEVRARANVRVSRLKADSLIQDIVIVAAIRSAKSLIAAVLSIWASQTVRIAHLADGEIPRFLVFSLSLDNARAVIGHIAGALGKPKLKHLLITKKEIRGWPESHPWRLALEEATDDAVVGRFVVRHPSGRPMEI